MKPTPKRGGRKQRAARSALDRRSALLRAAGLKLLADADYERISVARIAKEAGCSVGAFYYRYPDKAAYLRQLISEAFGRLEREYEREFLADEATDFRNGISLSEFVYFIVDGLGRSDSMGIIRASLKLGMIDPSALTKLTEYRRRIATDAVKLFSKGASEKASPSRVREAMQVVFASIIDAALLPQSAEMTAGKANLPVALSDVAANYINVPIDFRARRNSKPAPASPTMHKFERTRKESQKAETDFGAARTIAKPEVEAKHFKKRRRLL